MKNPYEIMRQEAIKRYGEGEKPISIYTSLRRSKKWFFKWLSRHRGDDDKWCQDQSRARRTSSRALAPEEEGIIVTMRRQLEAKKYSQVGAFQIQWELKRLGYDSLPEIWQINRTLKRYGLTQPKGPYQPKHKPYPITIPKEPGIMHQMDFTPGRNIAKQGVTRALNTMDVVSGRVKIAISRSRRAKEVSGHMINTWKHLGIPKYLQVDNDPTFSPHNNHPRDLSYILRLILLMGIEPIFIPPYEPWRNGCVEKFNEQYKKTFFNNSRWESIDHLGSGASEFEQFHNDYHCYSTRGGMTPVQFEKSMNFKPKLLPKAFALPKGKLPRTPGKIHLVRFIRSNGTLNIFTEKFSVKQDLTHEYVKATVDIAEQQLHVYYQDEWVQSFDYQLSKNGG